MFILDYFHELRGLNFLQNNALFLFIFLPNATAFLERGLYCCYVIHCVPGGNNTKKKSCDVLKA